VRTLTIGALIGGYGAAMHLMVLHDFSFVILCRMQSGFPKSCASVLNYGTIYATLYGYN
jgi:hypothetical protein